MAEADSLLQLAFRVGGRNSVRGQDYGTLLGTSFWSGQLDLEWVVSQWWSPVAFADAGNVGRLDNPMAGFGIGISLLSGIIRFDLAKGINPSRPIRFDLLFQIPSL
jgi:outer membrane translocation and assembly module TamA